MQDLIIWPFAAIISLCLLPCSKLFSRPDAVASFTAQWEIAETLLPLDLLWIWVVSEQGLTLQLEPLPSATFGFCGLASAFIISSCLSSIPSPSVAIAISASSLGGSQEVSSSLFSLSPGVYIKQNIPLPPSATHRLHSSSPSPIFSPDVPSPAISLFFMSHMSLHQATLPFVV